MTPTTPYFVYTPNPFVCDGQSIIPCDLKPGESLKGFLLRHAPHLTEDGWTVSIGGAEVAPAMWGKTFPKEGMHIACRAVLGKQVVQLVAMAALTYFTFGFGAATAGMWGAGAVAGSIGALGALGVYMAGSILINKVLGPKVPKFGETAAAKQVYSLSSQRNSARAYEPIGTLWGEMRVTPDMASQPYTWYEGDDQYLSTILLGGVNVHSVSDLSIGDTPITSYQDVSVYYNGFAGMQSQSLPLYSNADSLAGGELENNGAWVTRTSSAGGIALQVDIEGQLFDVDNKGRILVNTVPLFIESRPVGGAWAPAHSETLSNASTDVLRRTIMLPVAAGQYEVRVRLGQPRWHDGDGKDACKLAWTALKSIQADTTDYTSFGRIGIKIKATGQFSGSVDTLHATYRAKPMPIWTGTAWATATTRENGLSNPGAIILQTLRGVKHNGKLQFGFGMADEDIDIEGLKAFMLHCAANDYTYDRWVTSEISLMEFCDEVARAGMGEFAWTDGSRPTAMFVAPGQPTSAVVNMANMAKASFSVDYAVASTADGIEYQYVDRARKFETSTIRVNAPGVTTPLNPARITGEGVTTEAHAAKMARFHLGQSLYQYKTINFGASIEHLDYRRLSVLSVSHDLTQWGFGGRVQEVVVGQGFIQVRLSEPVPPLSTPKLGLRLPGERDYRVWDVTPFVGNQEVLTLVGSWPVGERVPGDGDDNPAHDTLWCYDFKATPGYRVRVVNVEPEKDLSGADITCVPEGPEFWDYVLNGTYVPAPSPSALPQLARPSVQNVRVTEQTNIQGNTRWWQLSAVWESQGAAEYCQVWAGLDGSMLTLVDARATGNRSSWRIEEPGEYLIQVRPFDASGRAGDAISVVYVTYGVAVPPVNASNFVVQELAGGLRRFAWSFAGDTPVAFAGVQIRYVAGDTQVSAAAWDELTPLGDADDIYTAQFETTKPPSGLYTFALRTINTSGQLSANVLRFAVNLSGSFEQFQQVDLTPPPTPTGFTVDAGISYLFIGCDPQTYSQGRGHLVTRLYGATWTTGDLPVFADATVLAEFQGTVFSHPTNPATTWHLWITWVTRDGVESLTPAGGTNGLVVTSGQDVSSLLDALTGQITQSQLYADLATPIASIAGLTDATSQNAAAIVQEGVNRAAAVAAEAQARATAVQAESQARTSEILAAQAEVLADLESADAAVKTLLRREFASADAATLASAQSYSYSKAQTDGAIAAQSTALTASFTAADAATLASAQNFTYSKSTIDAATAATLATLRSEFAAADTSTLASAKSYAYSKAQADSAIATSANTLRAQLTGGSTGTDLNALTSGLLYQERIARVSATDSLAQQLTLLSAGAGEQFDYKSIWYFDSGIEGWSANLTTNTAVTAVNGWLRMTATTGTQTGRMFQSPDALDIAGAKYPQVRLRVRKVGAPTWVGRLYFTTTADSTWNTAKSLLVGGPTYDANNIGLLTFNMPAGWTGATIARIRFEASTNITAANYFELDWVAIGRPSPGASSAQLSALELATAAADAAEAAERTALAAEVAGKASGEALSALETRVSTAEGVNTSQGASITSLNNSLTTLTGTVNNKADATALNALTTRVTAAEGVNTSQGSSITTLTNSLNTLTSTVNTKADASALSDLTSRVTAAEGVNTTQSSNITTLTNSLTTLTSTVNTKADATALNALTTRVTAAEGVNTSQGSSITTLNNNLTTTNTNVTAAQTAANGAAALAGSKGKVLVQSTAPETADRLAQNLWIDTTNNANTPKRWSGSAWVAVTDKVATDAAAAAAAAQTTANTKADATALNALTTRVTAAEGVNTSQGSSITTLNNNVSTLTTGLATKADASAVTALDTRVTAAEGVNTSQASSITSLNSNLTTTNTNVTAAQTAANNAATLAGSKGKVLVQSAAPDVADRLAQNLWIDTTGSANTPKRWSGTAWVAVTDKVATDAAAAAAAAQATANTKADATALNALTTTVTGQGNTITAQGTRLNSLESTVNNGATGVAATATALNAVTTRVGTVEGQIVSQASAIQTVRSSLGTVGGENLFYNPSFDVESSSAGLADGWQVGANPGPTFTLTLPVSWLESAGKAQRIDFTGVTTSAYVDVSTPATRRPPVREGEALAVSASFRATVGVVARSYIQVYSASSTLLQTISGPTVTTTGVTQVLSCVLPAALANAASANVIFRVNGASTTAQSGFIEWDRAQAERGTTVSGWRDNSRALSAAIQTEASTRATQTGELYAKYTVKVDVAGLISGYGLASTANNAAPTSSFGVRANAFFVSPPAVASATAPSANLYDGFVWLDTSVVPNVTRYLSGSSWVLNAPVLPFVVQATPTTVNGVAVPAGVYANDLFVKNGTITNAKIANLAVDNAKIANLAVDNAKIANLSVSKLTAGSLAVGQYVQSTNYVPNVSGWQWRADGSAELGSQYIRGKLTAAQIDTRGLDIRDASGNVILSSGTSLKSQIAGNLPGGVTSNLLDTSTWVINQHGSAPGFSPNGGLFEQYRRAANLPDGSSGTTWFCYPGLYYNNAYGWDNANPQGTPAGDADGGWNTDTFPINNNRGYRFAVWLRREGGGVGTVYLGCQYGTVYDMPGTAINNNPYFVVVPLANLVVGRWYLAVGYIYPTSESAAGQRGQSGLYDGTTGQKVHGGTDYTWAAGATTGLHRAYLYYSAPGSHLELVWPRVEMTTGAEPSLAELLSMGSVSARNPLTQGNVSTYIANAAIGTAQIRELAVDTLRIKNNAVTVPKGVVTYYAGEMAGDTVTLDYPGHLFVTVSANWLAENNSVAFAQIRALCNGQRGPWVSISMPPGYSAAATAYGMFSVPAGAHFCSLEVSNTGQRITVSTTMFAIGVMK